MPFTWPHSLIYSKNWYEFFLSVYLCINNVLVIILFQFFNYLFLGQYDSLRMTEAMGDLERTLGPVFQLVLGGQTMLVVTKTEDIKIMYANEGKYPARPIFPALNLLRQKWFGTGGIISELEYKYINLTLI